MSTSQKHKDFVSETMGEKPVTDVAGIGETYGKKLIEKGFDKAYVLLGQFLLLKKDEDCFVDWLKTEFGFQERYAKSTHACLSEWCEFNL
ncbi:unnamed protein product [Bursaphelenchus okinawaensis]|uniref:Barrier-to-autointegration factor-like protein n=1 Tax=Bursaphelenchus okinawaensis TaxID=465554 RepID=A0A811L5B6_9BILA|nr:unnamed protein product [Bursaphelenchus okinawaensis]CAG9117868.1 unnamed protein product [Bursaphelenchus okinawaensis]